MVSQSSRHLVDPELLPGLDLFPAFDLTAESLPALRAQMAEIAKATPLPAVPVTISESTLPGINGPDVNVRIFRPDADKPRLETLKQIRPAILHIHGGGYVVGNAQMNDASNQQLSHDLDVIIVSVDYRLAPETPFPGPVEDCYTALKWLHDNAADLGVDPKRIAIAGESAGGGLAAALALLVRDRGEITIAYQHLIYPMIDDRTCIETEPHPFTGEFVWTSKSNKFGWTALLGHAPGSGSVSPYAAAARAEDLSGLPPTFLAVGALDLFLEENLDYARRLTRAGVATELHVYPGAYHGFEVMASAHIAQRAKENAFHALKRALYP